jgi:hypothetical protein
MDVPELPFWLISEHEHSLNPTIKLVGPIPRVAHIFSSPGKVIAYMMAHQDQRWAIHQVTSADGVIMAMADLHRQKIDTIRVDADPDGTGRQVVGVADLVAAYRRPANDDD